MKKYGNILLGALIITITSVTLNATRPRNEERLRHEIKSQYHSDRNEERHINGILIKIDWNKIFKMINNYHINAQTFDTGIHDQEAILTTPHNEKIIKNNNGTLLELAIETASDKAINTLIQKYNVNVCGKNNNCDHIFECALAVGNSNGHEPDAPIRTIRALIQNGAKPIKTKRDIFWMLNRYHDKKLINMLSKQK